MAQHIVIIQGHPDPAGDRFCHALADAYAAGAEAAGIEVKRIEVAKLEFALLRTQAEFEKGAPAPQIAAAQEAIRWAEHLVIVFPIWFGGPPAFLKAFFEQLLRKGFALSSPQAALMSLLAGKSVRVIVTMGAPLPIFRLILGGHGVASFVKGLLWATGAGPVRQTLFGRAHLEDPARKARWLAEVRALGARGA